MRLIDADRLENNLSCSCMGFGTGVFNVIRNCETIRPETLPIVQQLRAELEKVKMERDAAVNDCSGRCDTCAFEKDCAKHDANDADIMHWYYGDCEDWEWRGVKED